MKKLASTIFNFLPIILNVIFVIAAIFIISYFHPKQVNFNYNFVKNKTWIYDDLVSPIDFPIYKTNIQIEAEKMQQVEKLLPFFYRDTDLEDTNVKKFRIKLNKAIRDSTLSLKPVLKDELITNLKEVYENGIIQKVEGQYMDDKINLLSKNESEERRVSEFYTVKNAIEEIILDEKNNSQDLIILVNNFIEPNILIDEITKEKQIKNIIESISIIEGGYKAGQKIVAKNEVVDSEKYNVLKSLERTFKEKVDFKSNPIFTKSGYILISIILLAIYFGFLYNINKDVLIQPKKLLFLLLIIVGFLALAFFNTTLELQSIYLIPFAIIPILVQLFFGYEVAFYTVTVVMFFTALIVPYDVQYLIINFAVCYFALLVNINAVYWSRFFISTILIIVMFVCIYYAFELTKVNSLNALDFTEAKWLAVNGFLSLLAYFFVPIFERVFGFISNFSLLELSNVNSSILRKMQTEAPGSFAHSLQVGNLAEAAASAIGANPLLVKVGALYHDIGKINNPLYFIENQNVNFNPHDNIEAEESAKIIINHVIEGTEMAKKQRLPDSIIDFIRTHHGTQRLDYFWNKHLELSAEGDLDLISDESFNYPGPLPYSKETAILMLADTCEAACKSIKNHTSEAIEEMVNKVTDYKISNNQFANSNISFKEITTVKKVFIKMLKSIYHVRVAYPD